MDNDQPFDNSRDTDAKPSVHNKPRRGARSARGGASGGRWDKPRGGNRKGGPPVRTNADMIYGLHSVEAALRNPNRNILEFFLTQNAANRLAERFDGRLPRDPQIVTVKEIARRLEGDPVHQGALIYVEPLSRDDDLSQVNSGQLLLALDRITDPHNVGAILRTAVAFDADGVLVTARHAPQETATLAKSASGALEQIPVIAVTNLTNALETLKREGYTVVGLDSEGPEPLDRTPIGERTVLVLGAEGKGLRHGVREACDHLSRIDLPGKIVSLNVSNAAAISLYAIHSRRTG